MHKRHNPDTVIEAFGKGYSQAMEIDPNKRWLFTAGQVGVAPDGNTLDSIEDQVAQTWANILALLNEGGMGIDCTVPFGFESDFLRPVYPIEKVDPTDFFTDDQLANTKARMKGWVQSLAKYGR